MRPITQLLIRRDADFFNTTKKAFESMHVVLDSVVEFLNINPNQVEWESVDLLEDIILLVMLLDIDVNEEMQLMSEGYQLPDPRHLKRVFLIGLPVTLAEEGTKTEIMQYLSKIEEEKVKRGIEYNRGDLVTSLGEVAAMEPYASSDEDDILLNESKADEVLRKGKKRLLH